MKIGMSKEEILDFLKRDKEASLYLNNALKKYPDEFLHFIDRLVELDVDGNYTQQEFREFVLNLLIQRLKQLTCFVVPDKKYAQHAFDEMIKIIKG